MSKLTQLSDLLTLHSDWHRREMACRAQVQDLFTAEAAGEISLDVFDRAVRKLDRKIRAADEFLEKLRGPIHQLQREIHADPEAAQREHDLEVVCVRGISVHGLAAAFMDPDAFEDHEPATDGLELTCGRSWIQGPRILLYTYLRGAEECSRDNITDSHEVDVCQWSERTPQWMVEKNLQSKIDAVYRAIERATAQL
jgi:hypothetical protein